MDKERTECGGLPIFEALEPRLLLNGAPPAPLLLDLQASSDSGAYDDDNLTNTAAAVVDITAAESDDVIRVYSEGTLLGEATQIGGTLYQYTFTTGQFVESANIITARSFDGIEESGDSPPLVLTLDVTPPRVVSLTPVPESAPDYTLSAVVASFDEPLDPGTVSRSVFGLIGSGGDGTFDDGNENVIIPDSVAATGPAEATLDLTGVLVPNDVYQVTLMGSGRGEPADPLAYYSFDNQLDPGNDDSGNGHVGTLLNAAWTADGIIDGAPSLSGYDSKMLVNPTVDLGDEWTIASWYKGLQSGGWQTLTRGAGGDHQIIVDASGYLGMFDNVGGSGFRSAGFDMGTLDNNVWHHVAAVGSGDAAVFYVDST